MPVHQPARPALERQTKQDLLRLLHPPGLRTTIAKRVRGIGFQFEVATEYGADYSVTVYIFVFRHHCVEHPRFSKSQEADLFAIIERVSKNMGGKYFHMQHHEHCRAFVFSLFLHE